MTHRAPRYVGPRECDHCGGEGEVEVGRRHHESWASAPYTVIGVVDCGQCLDGQVPCAWCGEVAGEWEGDDGRLYCGPHRVHAPVESVVVPSPSLVERRAS